MLESGGGRGGAVRGSEMLLVLTRPLLLVSTGGVSAPEVSRELNKVRPSCWLRSSGSLGGSEESGARKGLETALAGGQDEETGEVRKGLNGDFFNGEGGGGVEMLD